MNKKDFEKFYLANVDKIYRFVFFRVNKDKESAQDLVSEIFMKALENFESYDPQKSSSAWVFTIAKNHLANYWRDHKSALAIPEGGEDEWEDIFWKKLAFRSYQTIELKREIYELLDKLEGEEKELVTLHYLFGYSYTELGKIKGMSEGAVKVAAHRAIKKLRKVSLRGA